MPKGKATTSGASRLVLAGAAALLSGGGFSGAEASRFHRRDTSIYGPRPAYWARSAGFPHTEIFGGGVTRVSARATPPSASSIRT
jgi:hypothetical protein